MLALSFAPPIFKISFQFVSSRLVWIQFNLFVVFELKLLEVPHLLPDFSGKRQFVLLQI